MEQDRFERVESLFRDLRGLPLDEAKRRLEAECADDAELRAMALDLLRADAAESDEATEDLSLRVRAASDAIANESMDI
ncbi:MAG: hypothetical protein VYC34_09180, partial [Planctomycetota bacterium]|nr:hypothetical protein [Planctomycetota bacterium]